MNSWKSKNWVILNRCRAHFRRYRENCRCARNDLQHYCGGLALASAVGALSGTIPWSWALLAHLWVAVIYWVLSVRKSVQNCKAENDTVPVNSTELERIDRSVDRPV